MRPDPTLFHLLLGDHDWGRCRVAGSEKTLSELWVLDFGSRDPVPPDWDRTRAVITLPQLRDIIPPTRGEKALLLSARRAAAADANGNIYWIGDEPRQLYVRASGTRRSAKFWPDPRAFPVREGVFAPCAPEQPPTRRYTGLAITEDAWLVASFEDEGGQTGVEVFDLVGGGAPTEHIWPNSDPLRVRDLAAAPHGGLWLLDDHNRLFAFDRQLGMTSGAVGSELNELFQPTQGEPRTYVPPSSPPGRDLAAIDPSMNAIAIEPLSCGVIAILSKESLSAKIYVYAYDSGKLLGTANVGLSPPHDMAFGNAKLRDRTDGPRLIVTGGSGDQAMAFKVDGKDRDLRLEPTSEVFPLRRYGGRALVAVQGSIYYDSGDVPTWVPLVERPVVSFATRSEIVTPVFDGTMPQTIWDRVRLDGCVPSGTRVEIAARAGDQVGEDPEMLGEWFVQPSPILSSTGAELAGYDPAAIPATDPAHGKGSWELLLQHMHGRFLQLRLTLIGSGNGSPELRALRAWYPRQSWAERYLPAVYREDPAPADFLERFLANMEGTLTTIERCIVDSQALLDPKTAPKKVLDWLASWFDVALDPSWSEAQRRLFIAHAARFLSLRGTKRGVETALALAFSECADKRLFEDPEALRSGIRLTENFLTNRLGALTRTAAPGGRFWSPDEDNLALADRIARAGGKPNAGEDERANAVPLFPPPDSQDEWRQAMNDALGFVPEAGAAERLRWQQFQLGRGRPTPSDLPRGGVPPADADDWKDFTALASRSRQLWQEFLDGRYGRLAGLNEAHNSGWTSFTEVSLYDRLPVTQPARTDWYDFETRVLPADGSAHRFTVLLPVRKVGTDTSVLAQDRELARRIVELEKPAHTVFDVRFYFAMNRLGEARLGFDTTLGQGSRDPDLLPPAILGRAYLGESFIGPDGPPDTDNRRRLAC